MAKFKRDTSTKPKDKKPKKFDWRKENKRDSDHPSRKRDERRRGPPRFGGRSFDKPEKTKVNCDSCKKECEVPFKPTSHKPVYCNDCFKKKSGSKSNDHSKDLMEINQKLDKILKALEMD